MRCAWVIFLCALLLATGATAGQAQESCPALLRQGLRDYEEMNYGESQRLLEAALAQEQACAREERCQLHVTLAKLHLVRQEADAAVMHAKQALRLDPYLILNPMDTSPKVQGVFNQARDELRRETAGGPAGASPRTDDRSGNRRIAAWSVFGAGAAFTLISVTDLALAFNEDAEQRDAARRNNAEERNDHWRSANNYATTSAVFGGSAAVCFGTAFFLLSTLDQHDSLSFELSPGSRAILAPVAGPNGVGMGLVVGF